MGCRRAFVFLLLPLIVGCQSNGSFTANRLIAHQAMIDFSGLRPSQTISDLEIAASLPKHWIALPLQKRLLYVHQQWRSPDHSTGVGVAYIHLPLPMSSKTVVWFAKMQYAQQTTKDGKPAGQQLGQWTDGLGREWFEAENSKYHVKGYAVTDGFDAWIIYSGYRIADPMNMPEIAMAGRAIDTILPTPLVNAPVNRSQTASAK